MGSFCGRIAARSLLQLTEPSVEYSPDAVASRARLLERLLLEAYLANGVYGPEALKKQIMLWNACCAHEDPDHPDWINTRILADEEPASYVGRMSAHLAAKLAPRKWTDYGHV